MPKKNRAGNLLRPLNSEYLVSPSPSHTVIFNQEKDDISENLKSIVRRSRKSEDRFNSQKIQTKMGVNTPLSNVQCFHNRNNSRPHKILPFWTAFLLLIMYSCSATAEYASSGRFGYLGNQQSINNVSLLNDSSSHHMTAAKEYLGIFGWIEPADWTSVSPRSNKTGIQEGGFYGPREEEELPLETNNSTTNAETVFRERYKAMSDEEFLVALSNFQHANGIAITGVLDRDTMLIMTQLRCGVPDLTINPNATTTTPEPSTLSENESESNVTMTPQIREITSEPVNESSGEGSGVEPPTTAFPYFTTFSPSHLRKRRYSERPEFHHLSERAENETGPTEPVQEESISDGFEGSISEAELPSETRKESIENILEALRREKLAKMQNPNQNDTDIVQTSVLLQRIILNSRRERRQRTKRSTLFQMYSTRSGWGLAFPGRTITWRLVREWPSSNNQFMTSNEVWFTVKLAFRMWSEILPRNFLEDTVSPVSEVDILLGFGTNRHNRCPVPFTTQGQFIQEYAHAWPLPQAEIHFNDRQPYVPVSWVPTVTSGGAPQTRSSSNYPISLLKVAIHEIGHTLGLPHSDDRMSIMNPYYKPIQGSKDTDELRTSDRNSIQNIYGSCELPFDVAFDWVRRERAEDGVYRWKYNSYFFRRQWYWLYENRHHRPRYGDPKLTAHHWLGIMQINDQHRKIDGIVHVRELNSPEGPTFFFKGDIFLEYDNDRSRARIRDSAGNRYPRRIKDGFPGVPYPIDTVFYKADERIIYFFKNNLVYKFHWPSKRVVDVKTVSTTFPGWGGAAPLPSNIDSAYYSYTSQAYFFFKGAYFWKMAGNQERYLNRRIRIPNNSVGPRRRTSSTWRDICDVGETELVMDLPVS